MNPFACPTSSATRALVWFELKSGGLRVLGIGLAIAVLLMALFSLGIPFDRARPFAMIAVFGAVPAALLIFSRNAFGIRRGRKGPWISAFEATQPLGTAHLASVKLLVRTGCVLVALAVIAASMWISLSFVEEWGAWLTSVKKRDLSLALLQFRSDMAREFYGELTKQEFVAQFVYVPITIGLVITTLASLAALHARYPRRLLIVLIVLGLLIALASLSKVLPPMIRTAIPWGVAALLIVTTFNLLRSGIAEQSVTIRYACAAFAISLATFVSCLPARSVGSVLGTLVLPLTLLLLAPWILGRIRQT
jgi:hypothetical protein